MFRPKKKKHRKHDSRKKRSHNHVALHSPFTKDPNLRQAIEEEEECKTEENLKLEGNLLSEERARKHIQNVNSHMSGSSSPMSFSEYSSLGANSSSVSLGSLFEFKGVEPLLESRFSHPDR